MSKQEHILVTGGAGYIGSVLVPMLLQAGYSITVLDNFLYNQESLTDVCHYKELEIIHGDVRNKDLMQQVIKKADIIIPLACLVGAPICDKNPIDAKAINLEAIKTILELKTDKQKIIFPTTNADYRQVHPALY